MWNLREKKDANGKFLILVGTKKAESVQFWNEKIWSCSSFGTKFEGVGPFLEVKIQSQSVIILTRAFGSTPDFQVLEMH